MVLNSRVAQAALSDLANGHTGMRAIITWETARPVVIRYVTAHRDRLSPLSKREALRRVLPAGKLKSFL